MDSWEYHRYPVMASIGYLLGGPKTAATWVLISFGYLLTKSIFKKKEG